MRSAGPDCICVKAPDKCNAPRSADAEDDDGCCELRQGKAGLQAALRRASALSKALTTLISRERWQG